VKTELIGLNCFFATDHFDGLDKLLGLSLSKIFQHLIFYVSHIIIVRLKINLNLYIAEVEHSICTKGFEYTSC
jgi:hypothetical protein